MQISVKSNIDDIAKRLPAAFRKQVPFAASQAINETARRIATQDARESMEQDLDRPTPWTRSGVRYQRSNKANLTGAVYVLPTRWEYLRWQVNGGTQEARGQAIPIQVTDAGLAFFKRNRYGNLPRNAIKRASARDDTFWGTVRGTYGLWRRLGERGRGLMLLAAAVPSTTYTARWNYRGVVDRGVQRYFPNEFTRRLQAAIKTARL